MVGVAAPSILDVAHGELVLRILGSVRHGQIVRLKSPKCTIGSGPGSTLRLRARGVQPLHCLILRGATGTVIRRFARDTRLNGRAFTDTTLVPGDLLSIGPIQFQVLDAGQLPDRPTALASPTAESEPTVVPAERDTAAELGALPASATRPNRAWARRLVEELRSARREIAQLQKQREDAPPGDLQSQHDLEQQSKLLDQRRAELDTLVARLEEQEHVLKQRNEALDEQQQVLDEQRRALAEQQQALDEQQQAAVEQQQALDERSDEIARAEADLESERQALDEERRRQATDPAAATSDLSEQAEQLQARLAELDDQQEALQQERRRWQDERAEAEEQLRKRAEELDAQHAALDTQQRQFQQAQQRWTAEQGEAQKVLDARRNELQSRQTELDARQAELDSRRAELDSREAELDARQAELDARCAALDSREAELDTCQAELDERQQEFDARESETSENRRPPEADPAPAGAGHQEPSGESGQREDLEFEEPSGESPRSSEEVFRRLGIAPSFDDEDQREGENDLPPARDEPARSGTAETPDSSPHPDEHDDESIDDYMALLLDRVRATTGSSGERRESGASAGPPTPGPTPAPPPPEPADSSSQPPAPSPKLGDLVEMSPRAVAPEKSVDLGAMRDLANLSAHAAINRHARRVLFSAAASKLMVAIVSLSTAVILIWICWTRSHDHLTFCTAVAGFVIAFFYALRYIVLGGYMIFFKPGRNDQERKGHAAEGSGQ